MVTCRGPAQIFTRWGSRGERRSGYMAPSLTQKLSPTDNPLDMEKKQFSLKKFHRENKPLKVASHAQAQNGLSDIFGGSVSHNIMPGYLFIYLIIYLPCSCFGWTLLLQVLCFYGIPVCNICVSLSICFLCFFFGPLSSIYLFCPILTCLVLFSITFFYYYSLDVYLFTNERQKECGSGQERR